MSEWYKADLSPQLDGRALLEPSRPAIWLLDRRLTPGGMPDSFIEMFSGDRLPGVVERYVPSEAAAAIRQGDHWIVRAAISLRPPRPLEFPRIRVDSRYVRRVVWQRQAGEHYQPGTAFLRDGRRISFRAVRMRDGEAGLLTAQGTTRLAFAQIGELHLPADDFCRQAFAEVAVLAPDGQTRMIQVETDDGLMATASFDRLTAISGGSETVSDRWSHGLQPAWSLDLIWVPNDRIAVRRMFAPHQYPLHRMPRDEARWSGEGGLRWWGAQQNRNAGGGMLRCGELDYGWGFGVHAPSRLEFPLPPLPSTLRCEFGLDRLAQGGGCVQARIQLAGENVQTLYQSPPRVGSEPALSIGRVPLPPGTSGDGQRLVLEVDAAHTNRPVHADPLFIRDMADWLDPLLEFDSAAWGGLIQQQAVRQVPAWDGWTVDPQGKLAWPSRLRESHVDFGSFVRCVDVQDQPLQLSRDVELAPGRNWLVLSVSRGGARDTKLALQVRVAGNPAEERDIPYRDSWHAESEPLLFELTGPAGPPPRQASLEIQQAASSARIPVLWQGILLTQQLPMIRPLFEDDGEFLQMAGGEPAALTAQPRYSGTVSVSLPPPGSYRLALNRPLAIRERPAWGEFRFLRFAIRQSGGGRFCLTLHHDGEDSQPANYDAGAGDRSLPMAKRVWDRPLGDDWIVITRDVYADFGNLDVKAITLFATDGQAVVFDHLYAARSGNDFRHLPPRVAADAP